MRKKIITAILIVAIIAIFILWEIPTKPINIIDVVKEACTYKLLSTPQEIERKWEYYSFSVQGIYYTDEGKLKLSSQDFNELKNTLTNNTSFEIKNYNGHIFWQRLVPGKKMGTCALNGEELILEFSYTLW